MGFYGVMFSYIDKEPLVEPFVQGGGKLIPEDAGNPGHAYVSQESISVIIGVYKL